MILSHKNYTMSHSLHPLLSPTYLPLGHSHQGPHTSHHTPYIKTVSWNLTHEIHVIYHISIYNLRNEIVYVEYAMNILYIQTLISNMYDKLKKTCIASRLLHYYVNQTISGKKQKNYLFPSKYVTRPPSLFIISVANPSENFTLES
jgi:hypothetical protein